MVVLCETCLLAEFLIKKKTYRSVVTWAVFSLFTVTRFRKNIGRGKHKFLEI